MAKACYRHPSFGGRAGSSPVGAISSIGTLTSPRSAAVRSWLSALGLQQCCGHRQQQNRNRATGDEQRCVRAAHVFRFHSNGCDSNDDRQACRAVQRNLSASQATEDALPGMRVALCDSTDRSGRHESPGSRGRRSTGQRIGGDRGWVNSHARCDEKDGNQQTEGQALELVFQRLISIGERSAEHKTAANAPSTTSRSKAMARPPRLISSNKTRRTVICAVEPFGHRGQ